MINEYLHQLLHVSQSVWYGLKVHEVIFTNKTTVNLAKPFLSYQTSINNFLCEDNMTSRNLPYRNVTNVHLTVISDVQNEDVCHILY